jgi:hypothetical protein
MVLLPPLSPTVSVLLIPTPVLSLVATTLQGNVTMKLVPQSTVLSTTNSPCIDGAMECIVVEVSQCMQCTHVRHKLMAQTVQLAIESKVTTR